MFLCVWNRSLTLKLAKTQTHALTGSGEYYAFTILNNMLPTKTRDLIVEMKNEDNSTPEYASVIVQAHTICGSESHISIRTYSNRDL